MDENQDYSENQSDKADGDLANQVKELREQVAKLTTQASASAKSAASSLYDAASGQARDISDVAKAYPAALSTVSIGGVLAGIVIGLLLGGAGSR